MAVLDHQGNLPISRDENTRCVVGFCLFWLAFFVVLGGASYLISML